MRLLFVPDDPAVVAYRKNFENYRPPCSCDICTKWMPMHRRILAVLTPEDRKLYDEFLMMEANRSDDLGVAEAKLAGDWPGWEWIRDAVKLHASKASPSVSPA